MATGGCLCGAVRYEVRGPLRDVLICHCTECRRWSGHLFAATVRPTVEVVLTAYSIDRRGNPAAPPLPGPRLSGSLS